MRLGSIPKLSVVIPTHGPNRTIALEDQAVPVACSHRQDSGVENTLGCVLINVCAISQLTIKIRTHYPKRTICLDEQGMVKASSKTYHG